MRYFTFFLFCLSILNAQVIENTTNKDMQCEINYNAEFQMETIHGIEQRVQVAKAQHFTKVLKPQAKLKRKAKGKIICFNEDLRIISYNENAVQRVEGKSLERFKKRHKLLDIAAYANEDRSYVEDELGFKGRCKQYKDGEYCYIANGVDILYSKDGRVQKLFLYGNLFNNYAENTPFGKDALNALRVDGELLAPWIRNKNAKLLSRKPDFQTTNVIIYKKPNKYISSVVLTSRDGHLSSGRFHKESSKKLQDYLQAIEVTYILDDKAYAKKQQQKAKKSDVNIARRVKKVPYKATTTWGKVLNPKGAVPKNRFAAFYINTNQPKKLIATEKVDAVVIRYAWDQFHNIKSQDFGAYWVGDFYFPKDEDREIAISLSWSKARIIIDGMVVYDGGNNKSFTRHFTKGYHRIEVEYVNNWHTVDFSVQIEPKRKQYTKKELHSLFQSPRYNNTKLLYVSVYESKDKEGKIIVLPKNLNKDVILVLNSYDPVNWVLPKNPHHNIKAIVYAAAKPGAKVSGNGAKGVEVYAFKGRFSGYEMQKKCTCVNGGALFNCSGRYGSDVIADIENTFGKKMLGFSTAYGTSVVKVPQKLLDAKTKAEFAQNKADVIKAKKECAAQSNPSFENMLK